MNQNLSRRDCSGNILDAGDDTIVVSCIGIVWIASEIVEGDRSADGPRPCRSPYPGNCNGTSQGIDGRVVTCRHRQQFCRTDVFVSADIGNPGLDVIVDPVQ